MVRRSPVAIGIDVPRATFAISSGTSGGVGSSNQSGSYFSRRLRETNRARRGELAVCAEEQIAAIADGLAHLPDVAFGALELLEAGLAGVEGRVATGRVELQGRVPDRHVLGRSLRRDVGVEVHVRRITGLGVEVGVAAEALVHEPTEQLVDGLLDGLADDVPARHLDPAQDADERDDRGVPE